MKKIMLSLLIFALFLIDASAKDKGKEIFEKKGCDLCHKDHKDAIGPSLNKISKVYVGKGTDLLNYLKSKGKPIVEPKRASVMDPQLIKIKILSDEDMKNLATYIAVASDRPE